ncbi:MAG: S24 family peptidase [Pseudomonadota bacterium]
MHERIKMARKRARLTQSDLADYCKVNRVAVTQWESDNPKNRTKPSTKNLTLVSKATNTNPVWLISGRGDFNDSLMTGKKSEETISDSQETYYQRDYANEQHFNDGSIGEMVPIRGHVPLISSVPAGDFEEAIDNYEPGDADDWLPCPVPHSKGTFACQITGSSMEDVYPESENFIGFFDPAVEPRHGNDVIVRSVPDMSVTFKRYMVEGGKPYLRAMNKNWPNPIVEVNGEAEILATIIFVGKYPQREK